MDKNKPREFYFLVPKDRGFMGNSDLVQRFGDLHKREPVDQLVIAEERGFPTLRTYCMDHRIPISQVNEGPATAVERMLDNKYSDRVVCVTFQNPSRLVKRLNEYGITSGLI